jgi:hypothetical protein
MGLDLKLGPLKYEAGHSLPCKVQCDTMLCGIQVLMFQKICSFHLQRRRYPQKFFICLQSYAGSHPKRQQSSIP